MEKFKMEGLHGFMVGRTAFTMKHNLHKQFKSKGYTTTPEQWGILNLLEEEEGLSQSEIAEKTIKDKANITRILDVMQRNGLIQRQKHERDRRVYKIFLTDKGRNLQYELAHYVKEIDTQACIGLSISELNELNRILKKMYTNLDT
jgi:DNA-binding MarR family transcriptional regulator